MAKEKGKQDVANIWTWCAPQHRGFPTFAFLLLVVGVLWLLGELGYIVVNIPWWPVILIAVSLGWILDHYSKKFG